MIVLEALRGVRDHQISYYDAQIWASARLNRFRNRFRNRSCRHETTKHID